MDATPGNSDFLEAGRTADAGDNGTVAGQDSLDRRWAALLQAAAVVRALAGEAPEPVASGARDFPAAIRATAGWRRELARQGIDDLAAIMEPGLSALIRARTRGADPRAAAHALWREFVTARDALIGLAARG